MLKIQECTSIMRETLFISDLHLSPERPELINLCLNFLDTLSSNIDALYILGDLFEVWVGDDDDEPAYLPIKQALRTVGTRLPVYLLSGNRDFLIGDTFATQTGCTLLPEMTVIDLYGTSVLLLHGDILCTDDVTYQTMRRQLQDPRQQQALLAKSLSERRAIARTLREQSLAHTKIKGEEIMDVAQDSVLQMMRTHCVHHLIHGHTHRPARHDFDLDGHPATRMVLGDWYTQGSVLQCTVEGWTLQVLESAPSSSIKYPTS